VARKLIFIYTTTFKDRKTNELVRKKEIEMFDVLSTLAVAGPQAGAAQPNPIVAFAPFVLMFIVIYFLILRPQQQKQKQHEMMLQGVKKGDRVVTNGGIIGTVIGVKEKELVLKVGDDGVKLEFVKSAVAYVVPPTSA
jgi:preprotein translocase subunit YajC